jgi:type II secretory pathway pseudopilin PulG
VREERVECGRRKGRAAGEGARKGQRVRKAEWIHKDETDPPAPAPQPAQPQPAMSYEQLKAAVEANPALMQQLPPEYGHTSKPLNPVRRDKKLRRNGQPEQLGKVRLILGRAPPAPAPAPAPQPAQPQPAMSYEQLKAAVEANPALMQQRNRSHVETIKPCKKRQKTTKEWATRATGQSAPDSTRSSRTRTRSSSSTSTATTGHVVRAAQGRRRGNRSHVETIKPCKKRQKTTKEWATRATGQSAPDTRSSTWSLAPFVRRCLNGFERLVKALGAGASRPWCCFRKQASKTKEQVTRRNH